MSGQAMEYIKCRNYRTCKNKFLGIYPDDVGELCGECLDKVWE